MELQNKKIEFSNYWNDDHHLITYLDGDGRFNMWSMNYTIALVDNVNNNIVIKIPLPETRNCFGIMTCPDKNIFIYSHTNYINDNASIIIEIYQIIDNTINKLREFVIISGHSCGSTDGVLQRVGMNLFNVSWGDLTNSNQISFVSFDLDNYIPTQFINDFEMADFYIHYFISNNVIVKSDVISYNNKFDISLKNCITENIFCIVENYELPFTDNYSNNTEVETSILEFGIYNNRTLCLLRMKLESRIDVLHLEEYCVDILIDIDSNCVIFVSPKFTYDKYGFSVKSSIYLKNEVPMIYSSIKLIYIYKINQ
jgi:hypothetical protein